MLGYDKVAHNKSVIKLPESDFEVDVTVYTAYGDSEGHLEQQEEFQIIDYEFDRNVDDELESLQESIKIELEGEVAYPIVGSPEQHTMRDETGGTSMTIMASSVDRVEASRLAEEVLLEADKYLS